MYEGRNMAARGVVVVTLNYRLGVFGFLAHPELDAEQYGSGAFGLLDQLAALRWVQTNISAFGGNPGNVTLWGESAGAHSIGILMATSGTAGLFQKAIIQSGAFWDSPRGSIPQHDDALARGVALGKRLGDLDLSSLRSLPATELNHLTSWDFKSDPGVTAFGPSIDGALLQDSPAAVFERGEQLRIPVLGGWNTVEDLPFRPRALPHSSPEAFYDAAAGLFNEMQLSEFKTYYPAADSESAMQSAFKLVGDLVITEQTWTLLRLQQKILPAQTYVYEFSYSSAYSPIPAHVAEVPFVFGTFTPQYYAPQSPPADDGDRAISDKMMSYWSNFAASGNPNSRDLPYWPAFEGAGARSMKFDTSNVAASEIQSLRLDFIARSRQLGRYPEHWRD
jgi:para-nitrobenzyl esterase